MNNRAVALYLLGPSINVDMFETSMNAFEKLIREYPDESAAYYNLAVILSERKREAAAKGAWRDFLEIESKGNFAELVKKRLKDEESLVRKKHQKMPVTSTAVGKKPATKW